ncbi:hypothetical protein [Colwellia psychrerythraea]|uniref:Uncharacterized protein n=1 Tax=Colwellia psychrerythraea TaxID=28229 RepID=A0A099K6T5_COLPS|nr:hypothetical protein [Colwellia psychrerythraea]KGJ86504.1 hypothetical protein GAB14E_0777 [Colwellia psychrerythraea]
MEFNTPQAIRKIKLSPQSTILINGKNQCKLQAMSFALKYHKVDVTETFGELTVKGVVPVGG